MSTMSMPPPITTPLCAKHDRQNHKEEKIIKTFGENINGHQKLKF